LRTDRQLALDKAQKICIIEYMITIQKHPNLSNWTEIRFDGHKLLDQIHGKVRALAIAKLHAVKHKTSVLDIDEDKLHKTFLSK
jgi:hypothetical protein